MGVFPLKYVWEFIIAFFCRLATSLKNVWSSSWEPWIIQFSIHKVEFYNSLDIHFPNFCLLTQLRSEWESHEDNSEISALLGLKVPVRVSEVRRFRHIFIETKTSNKLICTFIINMKCMTLTLRRPTLVGFTRYMLGEQMTVILTYLIFQVSFLNVLLSAPFCRWGNGGKISILPTGSKLHSDGAGFWTQTIWYPEVCSRTLLQNACVSLRTLCPEGYGSLCAPPPPPTSGHRSQSERLILNHNRTNIFLLRGPR